MKMTSLLGDLKAHVGRGDVLVIVGAGISIGATNRDPVASWTGLLESGVDRCLVVVQGLPTDWAVRVRGEIRSGDLDDMLSAAEKISRRLGAPRGGEYGRWLRETVGSLKLADSAVLEALRDLGCPLATTNYDSLLTEVTGRPPVTWRQSADVERVIRGAEPGVLHLHGHWKDPESVIVGIRSYEQILGDQHAQAILHALRTVKTLLFVGFGAGLTDPNFDAFLGWTSRVFPSSEYRHYRLVRERERDEVQSQHPAEQRIFALPFGNEYSDLPGFLRDLPPQTSGVLADDQQGAQSSTPVSFQSWWTAGVTAELDQLTAESTFYYRGCACSGNWEPDTIQRRFQAVTVPASLGKDPEELDFGPGWTDGFPIPAGDGKRFERHLDDDGRIDFSEYPSLTEEQRAAWTPYRYFGLLRLPEIQLKTRTGLSFLPDGAAVITGEDCARFREHLLVIINPNDQPITNLRMRVQFPEGILHDPTIISQPPGSGVVCKPEPSRMAAIATGSGRVVFGNRPIEASGNYLVDASSLPPKELIEIRLTSVYQDQLARSEEEVAKNNSGETLLFYILGSFHYQWRDRSLKREFLVPLGYDPVARQVISLDPEEDTHERHVRMHHSWP
jgi:hypothetical protein